VNDRERLAGAILVVTVAAGIMTGILGREKAGSSVPATAQDVASDSCGRSRHGYIRLDINTATPEELMALPSIGPARARAIADWRDRNGPFGKVEDLMEIKGIGKKTVALIREYVCVGGSDSLTSK
jgi:comEA protein